MSQSGNGILLTFRRNEIQPQEKNSEKILELLNLQPALSAKALAEKMNLTSRAVEKQMGALKKSSKLYRIGPAKSERWNVVSQAPHSN